MRAALWFLGLFGVAVAAALFAGNNQGTITVFWPPYRLDLSLNLVVLLLALFFLVLHVALRALAALFAMPGHARSWRIQHQERAMHVALLDALSHMMAGRFIRARKAAEVVLARESAMARSGETLAYAGRLRALSHLLAAESAQSLQDKVAREDHLRQSLEQASRRDAQETREGVQLRAARWALEDHDAQGALQWLNDLPQGASRRTLALRLRLQAARMAHQTQLALETARLLAKHRAFSAVTAPGILRSLALDLVFTAYDPDQLQTVWRKLEEAERLMPEVAIESSRRMLKVGGDIELARSWLLPVWERMLAQPGALTDAQRISLISALESSFSLASGAPEAAWLTRIERAQMAHPADASLQYLAGMTCMRLQLWGKAQQLLQQSLPRLKDSGLEKNAWVALAELADQRGDVVVATQAWKNAAQVSSST
ncbi:MAG: heme biosynthesis protein HemY [Gammaproteobacteria bacterium]|uniref:heme biosynthesis protein HemY n=1 Tax=Rhodoferax sp. TaxID=50421 RepID=UPI0017F359BC|nr:heme biosynthesis HemY N-terminal domain-containing protein [Rhodoferax sp.]MBU3898204.1 heme biosynthesis protein HemY [Gammaproteobacteria bacterium]MBA3057872.1 heme biosynthesis protein HemY [Rhodoferax sp.]MBU3996510.1 heme biosynthesis protein HemY [Gammaproteobacteria bacterium]MBU4019019.1 heme biosynthesis protein HemY [Gammaproteobacteria bacterium]MBU4081639.1 heme biosynthesis protein HemY [Gammaproteobacteria bacterium]